MFPASFVYSFLALLSCIFALSQPLITTCLPDIESVKMIWTEIPDSIPPDLTNDQKKGYITAWRLDSLDNSFREFINNTPCLWANEDKIEQYRDYVKAIKTAPDASSMLHRNSTLIYM